MKITFFPLTPYLSLSSVRVAKTKRYNVIRRIILASIILYRTVAYKLETIRVVVATSIETCQYQ